MSEVIVALDTEINPAQLSHEGLEGAAVTVWERRTESIEHEPNPDPEGEPLENVVVGKERVVTAEVAEQVLGDAVSNHVADSGWVHPDDSPRLTLDKTPIDADGQDAATVTARYHPTVSPAQVTFAVNGAPTDVATTDGVAEIEIMKSEPGPITVEVEGQTVNLEAV